MPHDPDWARLATSPSFRSLIAHRRRMVAALACASLALVGALAVLSGWAPDAMGASLGGRWNVGIAFAVSQIVVIWAFGLAYARYSARTLDPLRAAAAEQGDAEPAEEPVPAESAR